VRIALLSDIHGNLPGLEAVLADLGRQEPVDQTIIAGDLAWAGPWPAEVVDRVRDLGVAVIQGNTDAFLAYTPQNPPDDKQEQHFGPLLSWTNGQLGPERVAYLLGLPFQHRVSTGKGDDLLVVHANPHDLDQAIAPGMPDAALDELLGPAGACDWAALAFGHVHIPYTRRWRDRLLVDVASAGLPMDGDRRVAYAILTWNGSAWQAEHHRVAYDAPAVAEAMKTHGMPRGKHFATRLLRAEYK
jgi:predicted phosphodiesterase